MMRTWEKQTSIKINMQCAWNLLNIIDYSIALTLLTPFHCRNGGRERALQIRIREYNLLEIQYISNKSKQFPASFQYSFNANFHGILFLLVGLYSVYSIFKAFLGSRDRFVGFLYCSPATLLNFIVSRFIKGRRSFDVERLFEPTTNCTAISETASLRTS